MSNSVFLEVDSSIKENQLKLVVSRSLELLSLVYYWIFVYDENNFFQTDETEQDFQKFLSEKESEFPSKYIQPFPGMLKLLNNFKARLTEYWRNRVIYVFVIGYLVVLEMF